MGGFLKQRILKFQEWSFDSKVWGKMISYQTLYYGGTAGSDFTFWVGPHQINIHRDFDDSIWYWSTPFMIGLGSISMEDKTTINKVFEILNSGQYDGIHVREFLQKIFTQ